MNQEKKQGFFVLLLALGLIFGSGILLYCVWKNPNLAVIIGMLWAVGAAAFWITNALTLRFAPGRIVRRRIDKAIQGTWDSYLSSYNGSGRLLEEYRKNSEEDEGDDGVSPCKVILTRREGLRKLVLSVTLLQVQGLELKEGERVLLILSGLMQSVFLVGTVDRVVRNREDCEVYITLWKGLICEKERELFL